ncbi:hypothetical protein AVEN_110969-1 [Araneus ventricosus]|uniref:Mos1 transposase HTH domain-containing protein n=1 Tax=Araneus ventricosus TaxID=182803 RepID=A0A4Y2LGQ5_ARAVE|nr:hypothetical protein AVEN_110969-1 [Araneus ventricosus]
MFKTIHRPSNCEIRAIIKFLNARNVRPLEIYRQISGSQSGPSSIRLPFVSSSQEISCRQQFASDDEIEVNVQNWFRSQAAEFYEACMLQLVSRCDTCRNSHGEYVEK